MSDIEVDNQSTESLELSNTEMESSDIRLTQMNDLPSDESADEGIDPQNDQEKGKSTPNKKYKEMIKALLEANTITNPEILEYIRNTERKEILYGKFNLVRRKRSIQVEAFANQKEKHLFDFINTVLQYPPAIEMIQRSINTGKSYSSAIRRYVTFMANKEFIPENFVVDGLLMRECIQTDLERGENPSKSASANLIKSFIYGMKKLYICLQVWKTKDTPEAEETGTKSFWKIPRLHLIENYKKERIEEIAEKASKEFHNKGQRLDKDYTIKQAKQMMINMYELTAPEESTPKKNQKKTFDGINGALEFLIGHHIMVRSENKRAFEISDVSYPEKDSERGCIRMLTFQVGKTKTKAAGGKTSAVGSHRHRVPELCLVGGFAMSLWFRFDLKNGPLSGKYRPDFLKKSSWYKPKILFSSSRNSLKEYEPISASYENTLVQIVQESVGFVSAKKTHMGRGNTARYADAHNIEEAQIARGGLWGNEKSLGKYYLSHLAFNLIHLMAGFSKEEPYFIARDIKPPLELQKKIFPWLDSEYTRVVDRGPQNELTVQERDDAVIPFLEMLFEFRSVILQDLAIMVNKAPNSIFSNHPITKDPMFIKFKAEVIARDNEAILFCEEFRSVIDQISPAFTSKVESMQGGQKVIIRDLRSLGRRICAMEASNNKNSESSRNAEYSRSMDFEELKNSLLQVQNSLLQVQNSLNPNRYNSMHQAPAFSTNEPISPTESPEAPIVARREGAGDEDEPQGPTRRKKASPPDMPMSRLTSTVPELVEEWFVSKPGLLSIKERDELYRSGWRKGDKYIHKRRKVVITFIEKEIQDKEFYGDLNEANMGDLLEEYRKEKDIELNQLADHLSPMNRPKISSYLREKFHAKKT